MRHSLTSLLTCLLWCCTCIAAAQSKGYQYVHQGNRHLAAKNTAEAEKFYQRALTLSPNDSRAYYNLGNALLLQQRDSAAMEAYIKGASMEKNKLVKSMAYHNLGVVCQTQKNLTQAIGFYKEALRNNPADEEARYNLVLCQHQLKNGGGGGGSKPQQDKDDKKGEDKQKKDKQQQQQQQSKQQPPQQNQMSKDNAEQLLDLSKQEEQQTRQKIRNAQPRTRSLEKNW